MTDDISTSKGPHLLLPATPSALTGGDPMDVDEETVGHQDKEQVDEELDPDWPPGWDNMKKADIPPVQRPFSQRQWRVLRKLLTDLETNLENVEKRTLKIVQKRTSEMAKKPTREMVEKMTEETMDKSSLDAVMKTIADSRLLDLDHPKQDTRTLLKELSPAKLPLLYTRSEKCGVHVDRAREAEDWRLLNAIATSEYQEAACNARSSTMLTRLLTETNRILKNRKVKEDFHPGAYGDEVSDDGGSGAENDKGDRDAATFGSSVDETLIHDDYKRRHVPLYQYIHKLYQEAQEPSLPVLPNFEEMVATKKKNEESTKGVQAERQEFLKKYGCQDRQAYEKKRFQALRSTGS